jgi:hypothetical protein
MFGYDAFLASLFWLRSSWTVMLAIYLNHITYTSLSLSSIALSRLVLTAHLRASGSQVTGCINCRVIV